MLLDDRDDELALLIHVGRPDVPITRFTCKIGMSQGQDPESRAGVLRELRGDGPFAHPALADDTERALAEDGPEAS